MEEVRLSRRVGPETVQAVQDDANCLKRHLESITLPGGSINITVQPRKEAILLVATGHPILIKWLRLYAAETGWTIPGVKFNSTVVPPDQQTQQQQKQQQKIEKPISSIAIPPEITARNLRIAQIKATLPMSEQQQMELLKSKLMKAIPGRRYIDPDNVNGYILRDIAIADEILHTPNIDLSIVVGNYAIFQEDIVLLKVALKVYGGDQQLLQRLIQHATTMYSWIRRSLDAYVKTKLSMFKSTKDPKYKLNVFNSLYDIYKNFPESQQNLYLLMGDLALTVSSYTADIAKLRFMRTVKDPRTVTDELQELESLLTYLQPVALISVARDSTEQAQITAQLEIIEGYRTEMKTMANKNQRIR